MIHIERKKKGTMLRVEGSVPQILSEVRVVLEKVYEGLEGGEREAFVEMIQFLNPERTAEDAKEYLDKLIEERLKKEDEEEEYEEDDEVEEEDEDEEDEDEDFEDFLHEIKGLHAVKVDKKKMKKILKLLSEDDE